MIKITSEGEIKISKYNGGFIKSWRKPLKKRGLAALIVIILVVIAIGIIKYKAVEGSKNDLLTLKTIVRTFNIQGLHLKENKLKSPEEFNFNGIKPSIFNIGESKDILLVYIFKSFTQRDKMLMETDKFHNIFSLEEVPYNAKNALIVYMPFELPKTEDDYKSFVKTKNLISSTIFKNLNGGKEIVYKGESASWQGTFTLKYYQHWIEDENIKGRITI